MPSFKFYSHSTIIQIRILARIRHGLIKHITLLGLSIILSVRIYVLSRRMHIL